MGRIKIPLPGRLIVSIIYASIGAMDDAAREIEKKYGRVEFETDDIEFLHTKYYREEMGDNLKRKFFAFEKMVVFRIGNLEGKFLGRISPVRDAHID